MNTVVSKLGEQTQSILSELQVFMQQKARESGQITPDMIEKMFKDFETNLLTKVNVKLDEQQSQLIALTQSSANTVSSLSSPCGASKAPATTDSTIHHYDGQFHDVPKNFQFPNSPNLREGVRFWFKGLPVSSGGWGSSIKPFRKLTRLPLKLKNKYNLEWKRIFTYLEEYVPSSFVEPLDCDPATISEQSLTAFFEESKKALLSRLSYCFEGDGDPMKWKISTWSKKSHRSSVERYGTTEDKKLLPPATYRNKTRKQGKRSRWLKPNAKYPERQQKRRATYPERQPKKHHQMGAGG